MRDSPYVRRTGISLRLLGLDVVSREISVFGDYEEIRRVSPLVRVPTFVADDGTVLLDSTLIIEYGELIAGPARSLWPAAVAERSCGRCG